MDVEFAKSLELGSDHKEWDKASIFWMQRGSDYSHFAASVALREHTSRHSTLVQSSVDVVVPITWPANSANTQLVLLLDVKDRRRIESLRVKCATLARDDATLIAAERGIALRGKRFFDPNLVLIFGFESPLEMAGWFESIAIQTELALIDRDIDRMHALVFHATSANPSH